MRKSQTTHGNETLITLLGSDEEVQAEINSIWNLYPPETWGTWIKEDTTIKGTGDRFVIITHKAYV